MVLAAVCQLNSGGNVAANAAAAVGLIKRASAAGARAVFLPEASDFIAPAKTVAALTRSGENAAFVRSIHEAAKTHGVFVSVGIHEPPPTDAGGSDPDAQRCFNTQLLVCPSGEEVERYRKLHLFDVDIAGGLTILESNTTIPGSCMPRPVDSPIGSVGPLTCYDLRFPEVSLHLRRIGAHVLTYPSAFTVRTGAAHWELLLRARAVETQCYVLAAAQVGQHEGTARTSWGHAMAIDPFGTILAQCSDMPPAAPAFCLADIDLAHLESTRAEMPLWSQRRSGLYPQM